jgi:SAM-dependent methyltransferase
MQPAILDWLRCPRTRQPLEMRDARWTGGRVESAILSTVDGTASYPVRGFIPRFVPGATYADSFGLQWNLFRRTQLDSHSGHPISAARFWSATGWSAAQLAGRRVLDAGCGAGRFAEIALAAGAHVVALDCSTAVDAAYENLRHFPNLPVVHGDVYRLPFAPRTFDFVYALGVLQHTPDVPGAFAALPPMVAPGGRLCVDVYMRTWRTALNPYYWMRPLTTRVPRHRLFAVLQRAVPVMLPIRRRIARVPAVGACVKRLIPVADYHGVLPLDERQLTEWALLDTFDWLAPAYDRPQRPATIRRWLETAGVQDVEVLKAGHLVGRGSIAGA